MRIMDFLFPRHCAICNSKLAPDEEVVCLKCNIHLPRTTHFSDHTGNDLAKLFYSEPRIIKAAAFMIHHPSSDSAQIVYAMKYFHKKKHCRYMGQLLADEAQPTGFFDGIDYIIPIPLSIDREIERGYNQSHILAQGISDITGIPVLRDIVIRNSFTKSQTHLNSQERKINVANAYTLRDADCIKDKHILLIDDVITTGATTLSCANCILECQNTKISIVSLAFAKR